MYLPADRSEVTEPWLTEVLQDHPRFIEQPIDKIQLKHLGDGIGQLSTLVLADINHKDGSSIQLVVKLHANVEAMHDIGLKYGHYESEINFYNYLSNQIPLRTPEVYLAKMDHDMGRVLVIMESFAGWHSPNQVDGASVDEIKIAARNLAKLTAAFWEAPLQSKFSWVRDVDAEAFKSLPEDYVANIDEAMNRLHGKIPACSEKICRFVGANANELIQSLKDGPQALSHWDYRVENFFYGQDNYSQDNYSQDKEFVVIDWQLMMMTKPATDLAYLLGTNIDTELRREHERDIMLEFLENLKSAGVQNYELNDLERDYRYGQLHVSCIPVIGGAGIDLNNPRSVALMSAVATRLFTAIDDWDATALLKQKK